MFSIATSAPDLMAGDGLLERIEVDADQVDRLDSLALQRGHMLWVLAAGEQGGMQSRVQCLHPPAEDLFLTGELRDLGHLQPRLAQSAGGPAG